METRHSARQADAPRRRDRPAPASADRGPEPSATLLPKPPRWAQLSTPGNEEPEQEGPGEEALGVLGDVGAAPSPAVPEQRPHQAATAPPRPRWCSWPPRSGPGRNGRKYPTLEVSRKPRHRRDDVDDDRARSAVEVGHGRRHLTDPHHVEDDVEDAAVEPPSGKHRPPPADIEDRNGPAARRERTGSRRLGERNESSPPAPMSSGSSASEARKRAPQVHRTRGTKPRSLAQAAQQWRESEQARAARDRRSGTSRRGCRRGSRRKGRERSWDEVCRSLDPLYGAELRDDGPGWGRNGSLR